MYKSSLSLFYFYTNLTSTNYPSEVSDNGKFSIESSVPNDEISMSQTYDMNGNPL